MSLESAGHKLLQLKRLLKPRKESQRQGFIVTTLVSEVIHPFLSSSTCLEFSLGKQSVAAEVKLDLLSLTWGAS